MDADLLRIEIEHQRTNLMNRAYFARRTSEDMAFSLFKFQVSNYLRTYGYSKVPVLNNSSEESLRENEAEFRETETRFAEKLSMLEAEVEQLEKDGLPKNMIRLIRLRMIDARIERLTVFLELSDEAVSSVVRVFEQTRAQLAKVFPEPEPPGFFRRLFGREVPPPENLFCENELAQVRYENLESTWRAEIETLREDRARLMIPSTF